MLYYRMTLDKYSTERIETATEFELEQMVKEFETNQISVGKLGAFLAYNAIALTALAKFTSYYIKSNWKKRDDPQKLSKRQLTLFNIVKKGSVIGVLMGGLYVAGFLAVGYYTLPIATFKKYCELQETKNSYAVMFDPFYQEMLLFRKMKKFGLSESLIEEVREELNMKRDSLIAGKCLKEETITEIKKAIEVYSSNSLHS